MTARPWWLAALLLMSARLPAHTLSVSHLDIVVPDAGAPLRVELDLALRDLALTLPLDANGDDTVTWGELAAVRGPLEALVASGLTLSTARGDCQLQPTGLATRRYDDGAYATVRLSARCRRGGALRIRYTLLMDRDPQHRAIVTVRQGASVRTGIVRADVPRIDIPIGAGGAAGGGKPFLDFLGEGIRHILIGYDHLGFLLSLLLPAALLRVAGGWQPVERLRTGVAHVLGIVTAFTLAHSITLSLAALGWVTPASRWIEAGIAASVLLAALNNVWPLVVRRLWLVGFAFGLIHGFGFAGALLELGLPTGARLWALVGFNLGVEIGQLAVVCAVLPVLFAVRHWPWYPRFAMPLLSVAIACLASWWLWQRLLPS